LSVTNGITLRSLTGNPADVTINGNYPTTTNWCCSITYTGAVVIGFTFTNGCSATASGGGVVFANGLISNCVIAGNRIIGSYNGGGVYMTGGRVESCVIIGNTNSFYAGGMYMTGGTIKNSSILNNIARYSGGGMWISGGAVASNCVIAGNQLYNSDDGGGGVYVRGSVGAGPIIANCLIVSNYTTANGGGVYFYTANTGTLVNCTIASNYAANVAGGVYCNSAGTLRNCIVYTNSCGTIPASYGELNLNGAGWSFTNCSLGAVLAAYTNSIAATGTNNLFFTNPQFVNKDTGDFRLKPNSPCINTGVNDDWMAGATDMDGHHRLDPFSGRVDIGAYEYLPAGTLFRAH